MKTNLAWDVALAERLWREGRTWREIAKAVGAPETTIRHHGRRLGWPMRPAAPAKPTFHRPSSTGASTLPPLPSLEEWP